MQCFIVRCVHCSVKKSEMLVKVLCKTLSDFSRDRAVKHLSFNEEQIHKFDKLVSFVRTPRLSL